jgi:molybdopterin-dependent oxidoreductase alpha subunit
MSDIKQENLKIGHPKQTAAGIPAVLSTVKQVWQHLGMVRGVQLLSKVNQKGGFDCPGCAWPDPDDRRSMVEFCENGAKAIADEAMRRIIGPDFFKNQSVAELRQQSEYWLGQQGRLSQPMILRPGSQYYQPISWEEAFELVAAHLKSLDSPHQAAFYTSGRTSNEAAFLYQLMVRMYGTNNLPDCSDLCHESSGCALTEVLGSGKGSVKLEDFHHAEAIFVIGQNPGTNHPRMLLALQEAKRRGARIVSINPLHEAGLLNFKNPQEVTGMLGRGTDLSDLFLQVKINGDVAALKGIMKLMDERDQSSGGAIFDREFIATHTEGFEDFLSDLRQISWEEIVRSSGLSREELSAAADIACNAKSTIVCWAMGLTQHKNAVGNIREIVNFLLLRGNFGRPGAGACPVRGHSNVQGDRTMGIWERPSAQFLGYLAKSFDFTPPQEHGLDVLDTIKAMSEDRIKILICLGGNFLSASPDTEKVDQSLQRCSLTVHIATKLNHTHLTPGKTALLLPCLGRTERDVQASGEQFVTVENSMSVVHASRGSLTPASPHLLSEVQIVCRLAEKLFGGKFPQVRWAWLADDYARIRDLIERTLPGFERFNERIQAPEGFYLPHAVRDERKFLVAGGRAKFSINPIPRHHLGDDELLMMTIRTHDQYNTTVYGMDDRYRGIYGGRRAILIGKSDMTRLGLEPGDMVDLESNYSGINRTAKSFKLVEYDIPAGCIATYFPEANPVIPSDQKAEISGTPISKSVVVKLVKHQNVQRS